MLESKGEAARGSFSDLPLVVARTGAWFSTREIIPVSKYLAKCIDVGITYINLRVCG